MCQDSETREVLQRVEKQVQVLQQSTGRVSSSSEQFGAVQQEARVATAIEIMLLHVDNLKRSYEKEHNELEETRRILIEHKLLVDEPNISHEVRSIRNRSISVMHSSVHSVSYILSLLSDWLSCVKFCRFCHIGCLVLYFVTFVRLLVLCYILSLLSDWLFCVSCVSLSTRAF